MSELQFDVVVNQEEQYSIWPAGKEIPAGWKLASFNGTKEQCLEFIKGVWIDMRPLSLQKIMAGNVAPL